MEAQENANATLTIDLDAIAANYTTICQIVGPGVECAAVVKGNAYGLGANKVATKLYAVGCKSFFVATFNEGVNLRKILNKANAETNTRIFVLNGPSLSSLHFFKDSWLIPVLNSLSQIDIWHKLRSRSDRIPPAALHIDTGMNRLGLQSNEIDKLTEQPANLKTLNVSLVMSHLACADDPENKKNTEQREEFERQKRKLPLTSASLANSAATMFDSKTHYNMVRPGIALYGGSPFLDAKKKLRDVVDLKSKIIQIREIDRPTTVGYGATHRVAHLTRLATVPIGYADGYLRSLGNAGFAFVCGKRVPVVGRVSMDLTVLDVTHTEAHVGSWVNLLGGPVNIDELAAAAGTISYELLTNIGERYRRIYLSNVN